MIKIDRACLADLHALKKSGYLFVDQDINKLGPTLLNQGYILAMTEDGKTIGAGGVMHRWKGSGEVWIAVHDDLKSRPKLLLSTTRCVIKMLREAGYHRLDMHVIADDSGLCRWAEALGFTFEGRMLKYDDQQRDHNLYSLT